MRINPVLVLALAAFTAVPNTAEASLLGWLFGGHDPCDTTTCNDDDHSAEPDLCVFADPCSGAYIEAEASADYTDDCGRGFFLDDTCTLDPLDPNLCLIVDPCDEGESFVLLGDPYVDDCGSFYTVDDDCSLIADSCVFEDPCGSSDISSVPGHVFTDSCGDTFFVYDDCGTLMIPPQTSDPVDDPHPPPPTCQDWDCDNSCGLFDWDCDGWSDCGLFDWACHDTVGCVGLSCEEESTTSTGGNNTCGLFDLHCWLSLDWLLPGECSLFDLDCDGCGLLDWECSAGETPSCTGSTCGDDDIDVCTNGWSSWDWGWSWDHDWSLGCSDSYDVDQCGLFDWDCGVDTDATCGLFDWDCGWDLHGWHSGGLGWAWDWELDWDWHHDDHDYGCIGLSCETDAGDCGRGYGWPLMASNVHVPTEVQLAATYRAQGVRGYVQGLAPNAQAMLFMGTENFSAQSCDWARPETCALEGAQPLLTLRADAEGRAAFAVPLDLADEERLALQVVGWRSGSPVASNPERLEDLQGHARFRWVHADPSQGDVSVSIDGTSQANVSLGGHLDVELDAGAHQVVLRDARTGSVLSDTSVSLATDGAYTALSADLDLPLVPLREDWGSVDLTAARVRLVSALDNVRIDADLDGVAEFSADTFAESVHDHGHRMVAGVDRTVAVHVDDGEPARFTVPAVDAGDEILVMVSGDPALHPMHRDGLTMTVVHRDGETETFRQDPVVHVVNTGATGGIVNASLDDSTGRARLGQVSQPIWGHEGRANIEVDGVMLNAMSLQRGERYLVTSLGTDGVLVLPEPSSSDTRIVIANAAFRSGAPMDIGAVTPNRFVPGVEALPYASTTPEAGLAAAPGTYRIGVAPAGSTQVLTDVRFDLEPNSRSFFFLVGDGSAMLRVRTDDGAWTSELLR